MCEPTTLAFATFALAAGSEIAKSEAAKGERKKIRSQADAQYAQTAADLRARLAEEQKSAAGRIAQATVRTDEAQGTAQASAAASGVSGRSIDLLLQDFDRENATFDTSIRENLSSVEGQIGRAQKQAALDRQFMIDSVPKYNPFLGALNLSNSIVQPAISQSRHAPPRKSKSSDIDT